MYQTFQQDMKEASQPEIYKNQDARPRLFYDLKIVQKGGTSSFYNSTELTT